MQWKSIDYYFFHLCGGLAYSERSGFFPKWLIEVYYSEKIYCEIKQLKEFMNEANELLWKPARLARCYSVTVNVIKIKHNTHKYSFYIIHTVCNGKDQTQASTYRPITLLLCLSK